MSPLHSTVAAALLAVCPATGAQAKAAAKPVAKDGPQAQGAPAAEARAKPKVFDVAWREESLEKALASVRDGAGVNMVVLWPALEAAGIKRDHAVTLKLKRVSAGQLLRTVLQSASAGLEGDQRLGYVIEDGIIKVGTRKSLKDAAAEAAKVYRIREAQMEIPNFTDAPSMDMTRAIGGAK